MAATQTHAHRLVYSHRPKITKLLKGCPVHALCANVLSQSETPESKSDQHSIARDLRPLSTNGQLRSAEHQSASMQCLPSSLQLAAKTIPATWVWTVPRFRRKRMEAQASTAQGIFVL
jgi:hypothetical protein